MAYQSPYQFALFRFLFGTYLIFVFLGYMLDAPELFLPQQMTIEDGEAPQFVVFHILRFFQSGVQVQLYLGLLAILALLLALGLARRWVAFVLWFGWIGLFFTQGRVEALHVFFVEWLLFVCVVARSGEGWAFHRFSPASWCLSGLLFWGSWFILALGLFILGFQKMTDPAWRQGTVLLQSWDSLLARDWFLVSGLCRLPGWVTGIMAWVYGGFLLSFPLLCLWRPARQWSWLILFSITVASLFVFATATETLAFLLLVVFVFDRRWGLPKASEDVPGPVFFDGTRLGGRAWAEFLSAEDVGERLKFAPLDGKVAAKKLGNEFVDQKPILVCPDSDSPDAEPRLTDAEAWIRLSAVIGRPWRWPMLLTKAPKWVRQFCFRMVTAAMCLYTGDRVRSASSPDTKRRFLS